jgi:hypothetical protein
MDDARQAPPNTIHFDGYRMGPNLDSPFKGGEHIPGLNVGGWQDAGDYDIQTPSNAMVLQNLVIGRELFGLDWDETAVDEKARQVEIRKPDGVADILQQIRHGTFQLLAQYKVFGHPIIGIVDPVLKQYTHLGDSGSQTDRLVYDPKLGPNEVSGGFSGRPDDRWAFTTEEKSTNYFVAAALAAASRALKESDPALSDEALAAAKVLWQRSAILPDSRPHWGGDEEEGFGAIWTDMPAISAAVELLIATGDPVYRDKIKAGLPAIKKNIAWLGGTAVRVLPYMDDSYRTEIKEAVKAVKAKADADLANNPFGVPVSKGTWAGASQVAMFGSNMYLLHKAFPDIIGTDYTLAALDFVLGRHPVHNLSLVTGVGTASKQIMYGHNRADYSFVPGAMTPGVLIIKPDFPEQKTEWPFLWFENEATVGDAAAYILAANAAIAVTKE